MPRRTRILVTALAILGTATPAAASDCRLAPNYQLSFMRPASSLGEGALPGGQERHRLPADRLRYAQREVGLGLNLGLSNPSGGSTINADGAFAIGERMRAVAALGSCDPSVDGAENGVVFGGAFAMHFLGSVDSPWGIVGQLGVSRFSSGGSSVLSVPVIVGAGWAVSERTVLYAGPMLNYERTSSGGSGYSYSDSDTRFGLIAGAQMHSRARWGANAALALQRIPGSGYDCGEYCYGDDSGSKLGINGSVRFTYLIGRNRAPAP